MTVRSVPLSESGVAQRFHRPGPEPAVFFEAEVAAAWSGSSAHRRPVVSVFITARRKVTPAAVNGSRASVLGGGEQLGGTGAFGRHPGTAPAAQEAVPGSVGPSGICAVSGPSCAGVAGATTATSSTCCPNAPALHLGPANYCWFTDPSRALCLKLAGTRPRTAR